MGPDRDDEPKTSLETTAADIARLTRDAPVATGFAKTAKAIEGFVKESGAPAWLGKEPGVADSLEQASKRAAASVERMEALKRTFAEVSVPRPVTLSREAMLGPEVVAIEGVQTQVEAMDEALGGRLDTMIQILDGMIEVQKEQATTLGGYVALFRAAHESDRKLARWAIRIATASLVVTALGVLASIVIR